MKTEHIRKDTTEKVSKLSDKSRNIVNETLNTELDNLLDQDDNGAGSGGSVGWSDFSEVDVIDTKSSGNNLNVTVDKIENNQSISQLKARTVSVDSTTLNAPASEHLTQGKNSRNIKADLFEIAELKSKIRKLETERDSLKYFVYCINLMLQIKILGFH